MQPEEGQSPPGGSADGATHQASSSRTRPLHPPGDAAAARRLEAVPARARQLDGSSLTSSGFTCSVCGEYHAERLLDIRAELPDEVFALSGSERRQRADVEDDFCRLDGERYFVRGLIEIPITPPTYFGYGVWVEVAEEDCFHLIQVWHEPVYGESFTGRLANELDKYPGSRGLRVSLETREELPAVRIDEDHLLASEQRQGISDDRAEQLAAAGYH